MILPVLFALIGAMLYRIRGGWLPTGSTQLARAIFCLPTGGLALYLTGGPWWLGLATAFMAFAGLMIPHTHGQDFGRVDDDEAEDFATMASIGMSRLFLILLPAALYARNDAVMLAALAGLLHGACYFVGWRLPVKPAWRRSNGRHPVDCETAWAELLWGAVQWAAIAAVLGP